MLHPSARTFSDLLSSSPRRAWGFLLFLALFAVALPGVAYAHDSAGFFADTGTAWSSAPPPPRDTPGWWAPEDGGLVVFGVWLALCSIVSALYRRKAVASAFFVGTAIVAILLFFPSVAHAADTTNALAAVMNGVVGGILGLGVFFFGVPAVNGFSARLGLGRRSALVLRIAVTAVAALFPMAAFAQDGATTAAVGVLPLWQILGGAALQVVVAVAASRIGSAGADSIARLERLEKQMAVTREDFARRVELQDLRREIREDLDGQRGRIEQLYTQNSRILALLEESR